MNKKVFLLLREAIEEWNTHYSSENGPYMFLGGWSPFMKNYHCLAEQLEAIWRGLA